MSPAINRAPKCSEWVYSYDQKNKSSIIDFLCHSNKIVQGLRFQVRENSTDSTTLAEYSFSFYQFSQRVSLSRFSKEKIKTRKSPTLHRRAEGYRDFFLQTSWRPGTKDHRRTKDQGVSFLQTSWMSGYLYISLPPSLQTS